MNDAEASHYLLEFLDKELQWTLRAATEWHVQNSLHLSLGGYEVQVFAMDSTFLHARTLFEFLTQLTSENYYGCDNFGVPPLKSDLYQADWKAPLHAYMMHAQDRSKPRQLKSFDGLNAKDLNQMPVDFGKEIVRLWTEFAKSLGCSSNARMAELAGSARTLLTSAIENAAKVATSEIALQHATRQGKIIPPLQWEP